ncbi:Por secretion system C-terminal sorting domain-containing protein [Lutibacter agarilyticus]|uniref:Por secretion system C-terminal sorting domain-containing protein n=1 Tax=Lutibacter agarilyticus TaxID=1109740 RepID=A0A238VCC0_9FLAO|nr:leucine-rich repeat domain-containing protein [Lutibacter agarilyticus]SNR32042.1 Por secretion system C-terminal sorting domain-containing protein [Lutibacter agarilyticus]
MKKLLLFVTLISFSFIQAQTFTIDNINYEVIPSTTNVKVTGLASPVTDMVIPETVNNSSIDYTVTMIDDNAFEDKIDLSSAVIPNSVTSIGANAFKGCLFMTSLDIGDSVTSIGNDAFQSCASLTTIDLPNSLKTIGDRAFEYNGLLSLAIPNSVETIGSYAFYGSDVLASISIGNSVTSIDVFAFGVQALNSTLTSVSCAIPSPLTINANVFSNRNLSACNLIVLSSSLSAYQTADVWKDFNTINGTLSVENVLLQNEISFYPNPIQNELFIDVKGLNNAKLEVINVQGKQQFNHVLRKINTINTSNLSTGIYFIKVTSDEGTISKKIIKN